MLGYYNYTVILTYMSLASSVFGMTMAVSGRYKTAVFCLALSGLLDMFDGKVARSKKDRTEDEKNFGIQLDSLCDVVCFGAFPALICYLLGVRGLLGLSIIIFYCINSVIRLAYFNVLEGKRQQNEGGAAKYYHGLPITSMAMVLPMAFMTQFFISKHAFIILLHVVLFLVGLLFVVDFKLKKPNNATIAILVGIVTVMVIITFFWVQFRIPKQSDPGWLNRFFETVVEESDSSGE
ncbi:MAG: CDP-alcohol phosphatidyltransferase family protein [Lachnospiraceae bacterium]|nr:CDP-alcohol phosphatidyltransferase family protein [Lachnospiraceae bacterium]MDY5742446.1 CDP-alcohol phosphatidyltransferase family protein [Lachnospiraceae bacterium]